MPTWSEGDETAAPPDTTQYPGGQSALAGEYPGGQAWREQQESGQVPPGEGDCIVCGSAPATTGTVRIITGLILWLKWETVKGPFCRSCGTAVVRQHTNRTLLTGWWGVFAFPFNLFTVFANLNAGRRFKALPPPVPQPHVAGMAADPLDPGAPLSRRPGPYVGVLVVLAAIAWIGSDVVSQADRDDSGAIVGAGEVAGSDLKVGDCFDLPPGEFINVAARPCTEPHDMELVATVEHPAPEDAPYPSDDEFTRAAADGCLSGFQDYVGIAFQESELNMTTITPAKDGWEANDRRIQCVVNMEGEKLSTSVKASNR